MGARARGGSRQAGKAVGQARGCACGGGQQHVMLAMLDVDQDFFPAGMGGGGYFLVILGGVEILGSQVWGRSPLQCRLSHDRPSVCVCLPVREFTLNPKAVTAPPFSAPK